MRGVSASRFIAIIIFCFAWLSTKISSQSQPIAFENYGFEELRAPGPKSLDLAGSSCRLDLAGDRLIVLYAFGSFQATTKPALAALEKLRLEYGGRAIVAAGSQSIDAESPAPSYLSSVESGVVAELNLARTDPKGYAKFLREYRALIHNGVYERPGEIGVQLEEGTRAVDEAIGYLERQAALDPLTASKGLSSAAKAQAVDQGRSGATGHSGADGSSPFDRMNRYGKWLGIAGENIAYGAGDARGIVIQLIVDDGVESRGHRANIFKPSFKVVGIGIGRHPQYGTVCVQDFAGDYEEKN
ncbi:MAG: CAP domain-containing protein [Rectinemataceae bacterium]|jgi:uncharacterized protein YkwD